MSGACFIKGLYPRAEAVLESFDREGRFPHAVLIEGPEGSGKSSFARHAAMMILCTDQDGRPCGICRSCKKAAGGIHPDLLTFEGEGKARSFHVDKVRELRSQAFVLPNEGERKVLLLEDCETMTEQAQNALLKVLEEPPASAVFLLTCRGSGLLLETIRSRVSAIRLESPSPDALLSLLRTRFPEAGEASLLQAAEDARLNPGAALALLGGEDSGRLDSAGIFLEHLARGDELGALLLLKSYEKDRAGLVEWMEALRTQVSRRILEGGIRTPGGKIDPHKLYGIADIIDDAIRAAAGNPGGMLLGAGICARICAHLEM